MTVARQFDARARRIGRHDALLREVGRRLLERLEYIRLDPRTVLDVGCGLGRSRDGLLQRYPGARWVGVDISGAMAGAGAAEQRSAQGIARLWRERPLWAVADAACLPFGEAGVDLLHSNLMLNWHPAPPTVFREWQRVLRVDGLLMFSCLGPDSLKELRAAVGDALPCARPMNFVDMHDLGDMMVASGFASPVMDMETLTLTFAGPRELLREVRALGGNPRDDRSPALASGAQARRLLDALAERRGPDGRIPLTFEVAFGHAWKPAPRAAVAGGFALEALRAQLPKARR
jgi:malonyl-CoA O-methyltransferase